MEKTPGQLANESSISMRAFGVEEPATEQAGGSANNSTESSLEYVTVGADQEHMLVNVTSEYPNVNYPVVMFGYIMPFVLIITIITNTLVVMVLWKKHMRSPTNIVLFTMAIVDLCTLLFPSPWLLWFYTFGNYRSYISPPFVCWSHYIMTDVMPVYFHTSSIWLALLLAGQRYVYVCHPAAARTWCTVSKVRKAMISIMLVAALHQSTRLFDSFFTPVYVKLNSGEYQEACLINNASWVEKIGIFSYYGSYFTFRIVFVYTVPIVALITLNCLLFRALKAAENKRTELLGIKHKNATGSGVNHNHHHHNLQHNLHNRYNVSQSEGRTSFIEHSLSQFNERARNFKLAPILELGNRRSFRTKKSAEMARASRPRPSDLTVTIGTTSTSQMGACDLVSPDDKVNLVVGEIGSEQYLSLPKKVSQRSTVNNNDNDENKKNNTNNNRRGGEQNLNPESLAKLIMSTENNDDKFQARIPGNILGKGGNLGLAETNADLSIENGITIGDNNNNININNNNNKSTNDNDNNKIDRSPLPPMSSGSIFQSGRNETDYQMSCIESTCNCVDRQAMNLQRQPLVDRTNKSDGSTQSRDDSNMAQLDRPQLRRSNSSTLFDQTMPTSTATTTTTTTTTGTTTHTTIMTTTTSEAPSGSSQRCRQLSSDGRDNSINRATSNQRYKRNHDGSKDGVSIIDLDDSWRGVCELHHHHHHHHHQHQNDQHEYLHQPDGSEEGELNDDDERAKVQAGRKLVRSSNLAEIEVRSEKNLVRPEEGEEEAVEGEEPEEDYSCAGCNSCNQNEDSYECKHCALNTTTSSKDSKPDELNVGLAGTGSMKRSGPLERGVPLGGPLSVCSSLMGAEHSDSHSASSTSETPTSGSREDSSEFAAIGRRSVCDLCKKAMAAAAAASQLRPIKPQAGDLCEISLPGKHQLSLAVGRSPMELSSASSLLQPPLHLGPKSNKTNLNLDIRKGNLNSREQQVDASSLLEANMLNSGSIIRSASRDEGSTTLGRQDELGGSYNTMVVSSNTSGGVSTSLRTMDSNRTTLMLIVVVTVFLLVEVPVAVVTLAHVILNTLIPDYTRYTDLERMFKFIKLFTNFFIMISYSVNFTIYCSMSKKFRETFWDLFSCSKRSKLKRVHRLLNQHQLLVMGDQGNHNCSIKKNNINVNSTSKAFASRFANDRSSNAFQTQSCIPLGGASVQIDFGTSSNADDQAKKLIKSRDTPLSGPVSTTTDGNNNEIFNKDNNDIMGNHAVGQANLQPQSRKYS